MGAFCVFGVSRSVCRKLAEKSVSTLVKDGGRMRGLSPAEWGEAVRAEGDRMFAESEKIVRISPELDAPQFCRDWIAAGVNDVRMTKLMCRGEKVDKHGAVVMKLGAPVLTWLPYDESQVWPRPFGESNKVALTA